MDGLQLSRNIHFVGRDGTHYAAIITAIHTQDGCINCIAWNECGGQIPNTLTIDFDATGKRPYSWHWPEKV